MELIISRMALQVIQNAGSSKEDVWEDDTKKTIEKDRKQLLSELASKHKKL